MPKRKKANSEKQDQTCEELIPGVPMESALRFLCDRAHVFKLPHVFDLSQAELEREEQFTADFSLRWEFRLASLARKGQKEIEPSDILQAMISRGWVERVPIKNRNYKQRYKVTDAGKNLAAESVRIFKWPAGKSKIIPSPRYVRWERGVWARHLAHVQAERARLGIDDGLASHQRDIWDDLQNGLDEDAMAQMLDWWNYNMEALVKRDRYGSRPARPRIEVFVSINQRGKLAVTWEPVGLQHGAESDWFDWRRHHPNNELLLVRSVGSAARHFPGMYYPEYHTPDEVMIDSILLQALAALIGELKARLNRHFDVTMYSDIFIETQKVSNPKWPELHDNVLATWSIETVEYRQKRLERAEIKRFSETYGCSIEEFAKAFVDADARKRSGPPPSPQSRDQRVAKLLQGAGHGKITLTVVTRYRELLERHRPGIIPSIMVPEPPSASEAPASIIVPFKKPNGTKPPDGDGPGPAAA